MMGAKIFQALETDIQEELKLAFLDAETNLMETYVNITSEELEIFLQVRDKGRVINLPVVFKRDVDRRF